MHDLFRYLTRKNVCRNALLGNDAAPYDTLRAPSDARSVLRLIHHYRVFCSVRCLAFVSSLIAA